jgi:hypothetical protein
MKPTVELVVGLGLIISLAEGDRRTRTRSGPSKDVGYSTAVAAHEPCQAQVTAGLSEQDVSEISSLVTARDRLPIRSIERLLPVSDRLNRHGGEVRATTASECYCGHGSFFDLTWEQNGGMWSIVGEGRWIC